MKRVLLQAEILEKLGVPLAVAVGEVAAHAQEQPLSAQEEAQKTAALLGKTVQLGTMIAAKINVKGADEEAEAVRALLTTMAGSLVSDFYRRTARLPEEGDLQKIASSLEATLAFSDNFIASEETAGRIAQMAPGTVYTDENQLVAQFTGAFAPVINAVAVFPFGRGENVLVQEIAIHLTAKAKTLVQEALSTGEAPKDTASLAELTILRGLVSIYVACHHEGIDKMKKQGTQPGAAPGDPMDSVWKMFETRAAMMDVLARQIVRAPQAPSSAGIQKGAPPATTPEQAPPVQNQSMNVPPATNAPPSLPDEPQRPVSPKEEAPPQTAAPGEESEQDGAANPMSFFGAGKKRDEDEGQ